MRDDQLSMKSVRPSSRRPLGSGAEEGGRNGTKADGVLAGSATAMKTFARETANVGAQHAHWLASGRTNRDLSE